MKSLLHAAALLSVTAASATAQVVISDDFEVDSSADYTIVDDGTPDGTQAFAFDYIAAGLPLAPRSAAGDVGGLRLTANDLANVSDAITCFHNTPVTADRYRLTVDVYMNFVPGSMGTTEHAHVGVGGDAVTPNQLFLPILGSGGYIAFDGDGGSSSDYRIFRDSANTPMGDPDSTTLPNSNAAYLNRGSNNSGFYFGNLFPAPPSEIAGSPGNIWTTVTLEVDNTAGVFSIFFDDSLTFRCPFSGSLVGAISIGLADAFSSVATTQFTVYDNLEVEILGALPGSNYCMAAPNSTLNTGLITADGSTAVADNNLSLRADILPQNATGYFLASTTQGFVMNPAGSEGNLCLGGSIGRYVGPGQIGDTGRLAGIKLDVDLTQIPSPVGPVAALPGDTWNFQCWHRDNNAGAATSNFTDAVSVTFN
ncbi:MAG: hypothetical protein AAGA20_19880 [Planctomycetota bacterium]